MSPFLLLAFVTAYFALLVVVSLLTSRKATQEDFYLAGRNAPWYLVAFGMIGTSLSGITFISVPGWVLTSNFSYMQMVFGYLAGYLVIGTILMPLYYKMNLTSIYSYLEERLGKFSYKTGATCFMASRTIGAAFRLFLVAMVMHNFILGPWGVPFWSTVLITIVLIWIYTFRGGIKTIVFTDSLQTFFMLAAVVFSLVYIGRSMDLGVFEMASVVGESDYSKVFVGDWQSDRNFFKQFLSGAFIAIVMTGLDQDMMQKNLSCKNIGEAQKNMFWFSISLVFVNLLFLSLGVMLYYFSVENGIAIPEKTDQLFPLLALEYFGPLASATFIIGLIAAAYSSADSALTALTTSFCVDFLGFEDEKKRSSTEQKRIRYGVHLSFSLLLLLIILIFNEISNEAVISEMFTVAGYTYGPLLGMFAFGMMTKRRVRDKVVPIICLSAPIICYILKSYSEEWFFGYQFGFELLILNGILTFSGLWYFSGRGGQRSAN